MWSRASGWASRILASFTTPGGSTPRRRSSPAPRLGKKDQDAVVLVNQYEDRAVTLVREALKRLPADRRAAFWRESIQADPTLRAIRRRIALPELAGPALSRDRESSSLSEPRP
jgi:hypothetical protein